MIIENEFSVAASPDEVYRLMLDVERLAPCIPGAEITGMREDGGYDARMSLKLGPVTMAYRGSVRISEQDDAARTASMLAKGTEARGQGTAQATLRMAVEPEGEGSRVRVSTDLLVTGRVAQMGKGIMQDVATRMIGEMARCMEAQLSGAADGSGAAGEPSPQAPEAAPAPAAGSAGQAAPPTPSAPAPPPAAPLDAGSLLGPVLWQRARRVLPVAAGAGLALALLRRLRRRGR